MHLSFRGILAATALSAGLALGAAAQTETPPPQQPPAQQPQALPPQVAAPDEKPRLAKVLVPAGTKLPLVLHNAITTRSAKKGDPIYLETLFPIIVEGRILIPAGSYVQGELMDAKRPGKVKGRGELLVRLNTLILPNGYLVDFNAIPTSAGTGGNEQVEEEGRIKGDTDKGGDIGTVVKTTSIGAGLGGIASRSGAGAGMGAGIGAAAALIGILLTRGPELEMPRGTTMDVMLDRPLWLESDKVQFTDPGRPSTLAGPPNRQPVRQKAPF